MVNKDYLAILDWLPQALDDNHVDTLLVVSHFLLKKTFNREEEAIINNHIIPQRKIIELCDLLKSKPDECLIEMQQLAEKYQWQQILSGLKDRGLPTLILPDKPFCFVSKWPEGGFVGRESEMEAIHDIVLNNIGKIAVDRTARSLVLHGLGGVGKTQLILKYIFCRKYNHAFDSIIWINAESTHSLTVSLQKLAEDLSIEYKTLSLDLLENALAKKLADKGPKCLVIFDNADGIDTIGSTETDSYKKFPMHFLGGNFFVITSRHNQWKDSIIQPVDAFKIDDAVDLVAKILDRYMAFTDGARELVSELECLPLAVKQAAHFIKWRNKRSTEDYSCRKYLSYYKEHVNAAKDYLEAKEKDFTSNMIVVFTTWKITFETIQSLCYRSDSKLYDTVKQITLGFGNENLPSIILNIASFICNENIPIEMFSELSNTNEHLQWGIEVLENFSLITTKHGLFDIHRLVQKAIGWTLTMNGLWDSKINIVKDILVESCPINPLDVDDFAKQRNLFPHLMELKHHFSRLSQMSSSVHRLYACILDACVNFNFGQTGKIVSQELLSMYESVYGKDHISSLYPLATLAKAYINLGEPHTAKYFQERVLKIQEQHYGSDHPKMIATLTNLGGINVGDPQMQKMFLERAQKINEKHYGPDHFEVAGILMNLGDVHSALGDPQTKKMMLERALKIQEHYYGPDHFIVADTLEKLAVLYCTLGDPLPLTSKIFLERALKINEKHYGSDHCIVAKSLAILGYVHFALGDPLTSKIFLERVLKIEEKNHGSDNIVVAKALMNLGIAHYNLGEYQTSKMLLEKTLKITENHYDCNNFEVVIVLANLSHVHGGLGDFRTEKMLLERALKIQEQHYGPDHFELAETLQNLGNACRKLGESQTAKIFLERALTIEVQKYGGYDHFNVAKTLVILGNVYWSLDESQKAKMFIERALKIQEQHYGIHHFEVVNTLVNLGGVCIALGESETSKILLERALEIQELHYGIDSVEVANTLVHLGDVCIELGESEISKILLEGALEIQKRHYGPEHVEVARAIQCLGNTYGALKDHIKERELLESALVIHQRHFGVEHVKTAFTQIRLAFCLLSLGRKSEAKLLFEKAYEVYNNHYGENHDKTKQIENILQALQPMMSRFLTSLKQLIVSRFQIMSIFL